MRQQPVIKWSGRPDYIPPNLSGIAKQDTQGQLMITPEKISKAETRKLFEGLLDRLGVGKW